MLIKIFGIKIIIKEEIKIQRKKKLKLLFLKIFIFLIFIENREIINFIE